MRADPRLVRDVSLVAAVPVEMIGRDREHDRDLRVERLRARELERRHLGDQHVDARRRPRRSAAGRRCPAATARRPDALSISAVSVVTVVLPLVPVTATIGAVGPFAGQIDLAADRHAARRAAATSAGWSTRTSGLGTTRSAAPTARADRVGRRRLDERARRARVASATRPAYVAARAGRVLEDRHVPALGAQPAGHRDPGLGQADHDGAHHSSPGPRRCRKSA